MKTFLSIKVGYSGLYQVGILMISLMFLATRVVVGYWNEPTFIVTITFFFFCAAGALSYVGPQFFRSKDFYLVHYDNVNVHLKNSKRHYSIPLQDVVSVEAHKTFNFLIKFRNDGQVMDGFIVPSYFYPFDATWIDKKFQEFRQKVQAAKDNNPDL